MVLAQGRYWKAQLVSPAQSVALTCLRDSLPEDLRELRDMRIDVPLNQWNRVIKLVLADRKLLGGLLLDFARRKELVSAAVGHDRAFSELQRVMLDATAALVESGTLVLTLPEGGSD